MKNARGSRHALEVAQVQSLNAAINGSQADLTWAALAHATSYQVQRSADGATGWADLTYTTSLAASDLDLSGSSDWYYRVRGLRSGAYGLWSASAHVVAAPTVVGPVNAATFSNDAAVGTGAWTNPGNAISSNNTYANFAGASPSKTSNYLKCLDFSAGLAAVPDGATITNIKLEFEVRSVGDDHALDNIVKIVKGGVVSGNNKASGTNYGGSDAYRSYDFATNAGGWNVALTGADIKAGNFGFVISSTCFVSLSGSVDIDHVRATFAYQ